MGNVQNEEATVAQIAHRVYYDTFEECETIASEETALLSTQQESIASCYSLDVVIGTTTGAGLGSFTTE